MIVRALDSDHDWTFGKGRNDYLSRNDAVRQTVKCRLMSFLGDCFFDTAAGLDWFNILGSKNLVQLELDVKAVILNTRDITGLKRISIVLNSSRQISISYEATTIYSEYNNEATIFDDTGYILDESGNILTTEDGNPIGA